MIKDVEFTKDTEDRDDYFIALYKKYIKGEIKAETKLIDADKIVPFSPDYEPKISEAFKADFDKRILADDFPLLHVYPKDGKYIMSDDYGSYYLYKKMALSQYPCLVLGE